MKMRLHMVTLLFLAGAIAAFFWRDALFGDGGPSSTVQPVSAPNEQLSQGSGELTPVEASPPLRENAVTEFVEVPDVPDVVPAIPARDPKNPYGISFERYVPHQRRPPSYWAEKYADADLGDRYEALLTLRERMVTEGMAHFSELRDAGRAQIYDPLYESDGQGGERLLPFSRNGDAQSPHFYLGAIADPETGVYDAENKSFKFECIWLPPEEFPEFYDLLDEYDWLVGKVKH